ncbi:MAG: alpha/beta hydrolase, partial [Pseudomonadota bacterium]
HATIGLALAASAVTACATPTRHSEISGTPSADGSDVRAEWVQTQLGDLFVKQAGSGDTTLVLWPSIFTDHRIYQGLTEALSGKYRLLLIDGPGHGRSQGPDTEFTMAQSAGALASILDHYALEKAVIGGTSWGGLTAAELSLSQPNRVQALILMNTPMEIDGRRPDMSATLIALGARYGLRLSLFRNGVANSFFSREALTVNPDFAEAFHAMLTHANPRQLSAAVRSVLLHGTPLKDRMADISVPTLVIAGTQDAMYPIEIQRKAAALAQQGDFAAVKGKHISAVEQPGPVATRIDDFIQRATAHHQAVR